MLEQLARFQPTQVQELELSEPILRLSRSEARGDVPYGDLLLLVRFHGSPLGVVELPFVDGVVEPSTIRDAVDAELDSALARHLEHDGGSSRRLAAEDPVSASPDCRALLRAAIAHGPDVTVIVPCADRPELLRIVLADLRLQSYRRFKILVVDNAPGRSGADAVVSELGLGEIPVDYVVELVPGSSRARNRGLSAASTPISAFVDADVRVDVDWLAHMVAPFHADPLVGASAGLILPAELETQAQRWMEEWGGFGKGFEDAVYDLHEHRSPSPIYPYGVSFGSGTSMAFETGLLRELGGFDRALGACTPSQGGEDIAALLDVILRDRRLVYASGAIVWHTHPTDVDDWLVKLESYGVGLMAHLTRVAIRYPGAGVDIARRMPAALRYFLSPTSQRNRAVSPTFPAAEVRKAELRGMARGPLAYARSHRYRPAPLSGP